MTLVDTLCREWLAHGVSTQPSDRPRAEAAVTALYRLIDAPPPRFVWVPSPTAALPLLPGRRDDPPTPAVHTARTSTTDSRPPVANRLASLQADLRERLEARILPRWSFRAEWEALRTTVHTSIRAPLRTALLPPTGSTPGLNWHGQHDAHWVARFALHARAGHTVYLPDDAAELALWTDLTTSTGWWWPRAGLCVMAERPTGIHLEALPNSARGEQRLHHDDGPALRFADGTGIHVLHGTVVPRWVITGPTVELIHGARSIEVRRSAIERLGWDDYIDQAGLRLVATAPDPGNPGAQLQLYDAPPEVWGRSRVLLAINGSVEPDGRQRRYGLGVPSYFDDPVAAAGWSYGLTGAQYAQLARRT
ncbi:DUF6745 domain-containing protein [Streptomyces sp. NPDC059076]|uniref:DUF6745 domain-containing protein n=1 Tax=unclassified Streptomyces TaxID=2593676 RepID=UPI0036CD5237